MGDLRVLVERGKLEPVPLRTMRLEVTGADRLGITPVGHRAPGDGSSSFV